jgi:hypothetical protein
MSAALLPRVRILAICDRIRKSKMEYGVFHLKGVRQGMIADTFPFFASLRAFLLLSSPRPGVFPCNIRIIHDRTDKTIFYAHLDPHPTFESDDGISAHRTPIRCYFPEPGRYSVQVLFFQKQGNDVLKGELPFYITTEGV